MESLIGKRFGILTVIEQAPSDANGRRRWVCDCDCGGQTTVITANLTRGHSTSCGCKRFHDLTGQRIGRLTVLGRSERLGSRGKRTVPLWECRCDCGAIVYKATDTLTNPALSMCADCAAKYAAEKMRAGAGYVNGTQISRLKGDQPNATNASGVRGVCLDRHSGKWRARLRFRGETVHLGYYDRLEDAVKARRQAEEDYYGEFLKSLS